jgi:uncharacterized membrane protein
MFNALAIILHLVAINVWVGGMFFMVIVLGKVMASLEVPEQHELWKKILARFFFWVWLAMIALLSTGIGMIVYRFGGLAHAPTYILIMASLGLLMATLFVIIYFVFYQRFKNATQQGDLRGSRQSLRMIRCLGIVNIIIGFCVMMVIGGGPLLAVM